MSKRKQVLLISDNEGSEKSDDEQSQPSIQNVASSLSSQHPPAKGGLYAKYYTFSKKDNIKVGKCLICEKKRKIEKCIKMTDCNTSGLKKHLRSCHKLLFDTEFGNKENVDIGQKTISEAFQQSQPKKILSQEMFDNMIVKWISIKYLPFNFFDDSETQELFKSLNSHVVVPKKDSLRNKVLSRFETTRKNLLKVFQNNHSKISFTVDGWTSVANKSFYGITAHFIDENWQLQSLVLDFVAANGKHTGKDIAKLFFETISSFHIENKVQGITVDNAASNTRFMQELEVLMNDNNYTFDANTQHFRCFAHILNLGVQDSLKLLRSVSVDCTSDDEDYDLESEDSDQNSCVAQLRKLFIKIKYSEQLQNKLKSCCETTNIKYLSPNIDVCTRWNSTYDMMKIGLHLKNALNILCENNEILSNLRISEEDWTLISAITKFLKNFKIVSTALGGDKYTTLPLVIVLFNMLLDDIEKQILELDRKEDRNLIDESLIAAFQSGRDKMLKHYAKTNWLYCACLVLDPRHKTETFDRSSWGREMKIQSLDTFHDILKQYNQETCTANCSNQELEANCNQGQESTADDEYNVDDYINLGMYYEESNPCSLQSEFEAYTNSPRAGKDTDILLWWKLHENTYPNMAKMAKDILSVTATSVPSERLFSKASLVIRKHRNSLNKDSARSLLCLNSWLTCDLVSRLDV